MTHLGRWFWQVVLFTALFVLGTQFRVHWWVVLFPISWLVVSFIGTFILSQQVVPDKESRR